MIVYVVIKVSGHFSSGAPLGVFASYAAAEDFVLPARRPREYQIIEYDVEGRPE